MGILCAFFIIVTPIVAQAPVVEYDGSEIFCHILKHFKFEPIRSIEELTEDKAKETLIILFGELAPLDAIRKQLVGIDECALLVASDRPSGNYQRSPGGFGWKWSESKLNAWRVNIIGREVRVPVDDSYQNSPRCFLLTPAEISRDHPIFRGMNIGLATNGPSYLRSDGSDLHLLASFPRSAQPVGGIFPDQEHLGYIFGTPAEADQRCLFLAGHGVFMNGMIVQRDNDNGLFAINTVRWLRDGPNGKRKYALMIHDGKVVESFDLPLTGLPPVPIPPVRVVNRMLRELENEGIIHRFLEEVVGWPNVVRFGLLAATIGLFVYGVWRLFPVRHSQEAVPLLYAMQTPTARPRPVVEQRQLELLSQNNLWEPAQALARQWFLDNADVEPPLWDEAPGAPPPAAHYRAGWWTRQKLAQQADLVWKFAVSDPATPVRLKEFRKLADAVHALNRAVQAGQLAFPRGGSPRGS